MVKRLYRWLQILFKEAEVVCHLCGEIFANMSSLLSHLNDIHRKKIFKCPLCPSTFVRTNRRVQHIIWKHLHITKKCAVCDRSFTDSSSYERHRHAHIALPIYSCDICAKSFRRKHGLQRHLGTFAHHQKERKGGVPHPIPRSRGNAIIREATHAIFS